jgi:hypothetical protein
VAAKVLEIINADIADVTGLGKVSRERISKSGDVHCTLYQVHAAKVHAEGKYPGASVSATVNKHFGIDKPRAEFVANFCGTQLSLW